MVGRGKITAPATATASGATGLVETTVDKRQTENVKIESGNGGQNEKASNAFNSKMAVGNDEFIDYSEGNGGNSTEQRKFRLKTIFQTRKKPSIRAKEKRIRQNRLLRKSLTPKNALMALNEVKGVQIAHSNIVPNQTGGFAVSITVNNTQYTGYGTSKAMAKNNACEKALRDIIIGRMRKHPRFNLKEVTKIEDGNDQPMEIGIKEQESDSGDDDNIPMLNLASFALYKLFSEWENEGYFIPELHPQSARPPIEKDVKPIKKPCVRSELPPNWELMHPTSLLCFMRPGVTCIDKGTVGDKQTIMQSVTVSVDGNEFFAIGQSKKIARRNVAIKACNELFGTNFPIEEPCITIKSGKEV